MIRTHSHAARVHGQLICGLKSTKSATNRAGFRCSSEFARWRGVFTSVAVILVLAGVPQPWVVRAQSAPDANLRYRRTVEAMHPSAGEISSNSVPLSGGGSLAGEASGGSTASGVSPLTRVQLDNGVDPNNMGKGDWIWTMSACESALHVSTPQAVIDYEASQGVQWVVLKAGDGPYYFMASGYLTSNLGDSQWNTTIIDYAHSKGLKIFAYVFVYGNSNGSTEAEELAVAKAVMGVGGDGLIIDAEGAYEGQAAAAAAYASGIKAAYPTRFLAYTPFPIISYHRSFPYIEFGTNCDAVMPQDYWGTIGVSVEYMVQWMDSEWNTWQNGLTGVYTNAIKPIIPLGQGYNTGTYTETTAEVTNFVYLLKTDPNPASRGGYHGVSFWSCQHHSAAVWAGIAAVNIGGISPSVFSASTEMASGITGGSATLNGMVVPNGDAATAWFEWGPTSAYGYQTAHTGVGSGYAVNRISAAVGGLASNRIYHYRLAANNGVATVHGCDRIFTTGGRVKAWGDDTFGQTDIPAGLTNAVAIAGGVYHELALKNDGEVVAWGRDDSGQADVPLGLNNVVGLAAGFAHSVALKSDGTVAVWGADNFGQRDIPLGLSNVVAIAAGTYHNLVLKSDGTVTAWGWDQYGQSTVPAGLVNVVEVAATFGDSIALKSDGTVTVWGDNTFGQVTGAAGLTNVVAVAGGQFHCLALAANGTVTAWGRDNKGQTSVPAGLAGVAAIACGQNYSLALKSDGTVVAWGDGAVGQTNLPAGLVDVAQLSGGLNSGLAIGSQLPQIASTVTNHVAAGLPAKVIISALQAAAGWSDPDGNPVMFGSAGPASANGAAVSSDATYIYYASPLTAEDHFDYTITDGALTATGTVYLEPTAATSPTIGNAIMDGNGHLTFSGYAIAGYTYGVESTPSLMAPVTWSEAGTATVGPDGRWTFTDLTNKPPMFYRLYYPDNPEHPPQ